MKNLKNLMERRADLQSQMRALVDAADQEQRAMTDEDVAAFDAAEAEIRSIDATIEREQRARGVGGNPAVGNNTQEKEEERAFADYILGRLSEDRATANNMTYTDNGAIIPTTIANRIIQAIKDRCPILQGATLYNIKGTLKIPVWGAKAGGENITVGYTDDFTELTAKSGAFASVDLGGYLAGALVLIGRRLEANGSFDVVSFVVTQIADEVAVWLEGQLLNGTGTSAAQGALNTTNELVAASATAITTDELIELQSMVKQQYQASACWTMNSKTFLACKKLKDSNGRYLLQDDVSGEFPYRILGKPVYLSDNMPAIAADTDVILYGDYAGLAVNMRENVTVEVLREKYATQHAVGVVTWLEFDSRIANHQMLAKLKMAAS